MSTSPREVSVRRAVLAYLKTLGPRVCYRSNPATPYGVTGDPDLMVCIGGQLVCIELKRPGWRPTPGWQASPQGRRVRKWAEAGAIVLVAWNRKSVEQMIEQLLASPVLSAPEEIYRRHRAPRATALAVEEVPPAAW